MFVILYENASTSCVLAANFISRMLLIIVMNLLADCLVVCTESFLIELGNPKCCIVHALSLTHKRREIKERGFRCWKYFATSNSLGVEPGIGEDIFYDTWAS